MERLPPIQSAGPGVQEPNPVAVFPQISVHLRSQGCPAVRHFTEPLTLSRIGRCIQHLCQGQDALHLFLCQLAAQLYVAPMPVPAHVGHTYFTYQPLMPHEFLYKHKRSYHRYYNEGRGFTRTSVRWR